MNESFTEQIEGLHQPHKLEQIGVLQTHLGFFPIFIGRSFVGRSENNDICINNKTISKIHAQIKADVNNVFIRDMNSTNKTMLNKHVLEPECYYSMRTGDILMFGRIQAQFHESNLNNYSPHFRDRSSRNSTPEQNSSAEYTPESNQTYSNGRSPLEVQENLMYNPHVPNRCKAFSLRTENDDHLENTVESDETKYNIDQESKLHIFHENTYDLAIICSPHKRKSSESHPIRNTALNKTEGLEDSHNVEKNDDYDSQSTEENDNYDGLLNPEESNDYDHPENCEEVDDRHSDQQVPETIEPVQQPENISENVEKPSVNRKNSKNPDGDKKESIEISKDDQTTSHNDVLKNSDQRVPNVLKLTDQDSLKTKFPNHSKAKAAGGPLRRSSRLMAKTKVTTYVIRDKKRRQ